MDETKITKGILDAYHEKLSSHISSDLLIVGAGPSGLTAAFYLAKKGFKVTILEKRLSPGGGIWGGGMGLNEVIIQEEALAHLKAVGVRYRKSGGDLYSVDAVELGSGLTFSALKAGAVILNLVTAEDICVEDERVIGVVANRTMISGALHVDPLMFHAKAVLDGTGHDAVLVEHLRRRGLFQITTPSGRIADGAMNATEGEAFVVEKTGEVYPGLWISGMSVCATFGGPRMGPIFGGMLISGKKVADLIARSLAV
ncbi:MAG: thiazole biosynthesis protein [Candidatus Omnitrophica bacterium]|nr:thiazole biosynthesis protein [Candidatus Omnitrophota bacterium]